MEGGQTEMKKEDLLAKLSANTHKQYDMPDMSTIKGITYNDVIEQFASMTKTVGGNVIMAEHDESISDVVRRAYPEAKVFACNMPELTLSQDANTGYRIINPDAIAEANELNGTDVGIVKGTIGVAENGCVWIPQTMKEKAMLFISEYLVILLRKADIVNNMHEAYERISMDDRYNFGTFISGPSKTADIEQALVMGAQAARGVTVVITD